MMSVSDVSRCPTLKLTFLCRRPAAAQTRASTEPKPNQATALLNKYIATPENRAQASSLYGKVNDATQQTLTRERKDRLARGVETVGAQGYKLFNNIRKGGEK